MRAEEQRRHSADYYDVGTAHAKNELPFDEMIFVWPVSVRDWNQDYLREQRNLAKEMCERIASWAARARGAYCAAC